VISSTLMPTNFTNWTVVCTDTNTGCSSDPSDIEVMEVYSRPVAFPTNNGPVCHDDPIELYGNTVPGTIPNALYRWFDENDSLVSTQQNPIFYGLASGTYTYSLLVTQGYCVSDTAYTTFTIEPILPSPIMMPDTAVCEDGTITLYTNTIADIHFWTGPNGFTSNLQYPPVITPATLDDEGWYKLHYSINGCPSDSDSVYVTVNPKPAKPVLFSNSPVCESDTIYIGTYSSCGNYNFLGYGTYPSGNLIFLDTNLTDSVLVISSTLMPTNFTNWTVVCTDTNTGCSSDPSDIEVLEVYDRPVAFPTNNGPVCHDDPIELYGNTVPGTIPGALYRWFDENDSLVSTQQNPIFYGLASGTYTYSLLVSQGYCTSDTAYTTFTIEPILPSPIMMPDTAVCEDGTITLYTNTIADIHFWTGPNGFTSNLQYPPVITPATLDDEGWYKLHYSINGCPSDSDSVFVTVNPKPAKPVLFSNSPVCESDTIYIGTYSSCGNYNFLGYGTYPSGNLIFLDTNLTDSVLVISSTLMPTNFTNWTVVCTDTNTGCSSDPSDIEVLEVYDRPVAFPTNNGPVCYNDPVELYGNTVPGTIPGAMYQWFDTSGVMVSTQQNPIIYGLAPGTYTYSILVTQGYCVSDTAYTTFTVDSILPAPIMQADFAVCEDDPIVLTTSTLADVHYWTGPNGFTSNLQFPLAIQPATQLNEGWYKLHYTKGGCPSDSDSVYVTVNPKPAKPVLFSNSPVCESDTIYIGTYSSCGNYNFLGYGTYPSGNLIFLDTNLTDSVLVISSTLMPTNFTNWAVVCTDTNTGCSSDPSDIEVLEVYDRPVAFPTNNGPVCFGDPVELYGNTNPGTLPGALYQWFDTSGVLVSTQQNPIIYNLSPGTYTYSFLVTIGYCVSDTATTTFVVDSILPAPGMQADFSVCADDDIVLFTTTNADNYYWTGPNGFTSGLKNPLAITNASYLNEGWYRLHYDKGGCPSDTDSVYVTVHPKPAKPVLYTNSPVCESDTLFVGTTSSCGLYTFEAYGAVPSGTLIYSVTNVTDSIIAIPTNLLTTNITHWRLICTDTVTGCSSDPSELEMVEIYTRPVAFPTSNSPVCSGDPVMLYGNTSPGTLPGAMYQWYDSSYNLVATAQNPIFYNVPDGIHTWHLVVTLGFCQSDTASVTVVVAPKLPAPVLPANFSVCEDSPILLSTTTTATQYQWSGPNGFFSTLQNPPAILNASNLNEGWYVLKYWNSQGCESEPDSVYVTVHFLPPTPTIVSNSPICDNENLVLTTSVSCGEYLWIGPAGSSFATLTNPHLTTTTNYTSIPPTDTAYMAGQWSVICVDTVTGCQSMASNPVTVVINPKPLAFPTSNSPVCSGHAVELYGNTIPGTIPGAMWEWYDESSPKQLVSTNQNPVLSGLANGFHTFYLVVTANGCVSDTMPVMVEVAPSLPQPVLPPNFSVCEGTPILLSTTTAAAWYLWSGPNGFSSNLQNPPAILSATNLNEGWYVLQYGDINGCLSTADSVYVTVNFKPQTPTIMSNSPICDNENLQLSTSAVCGEYLWIGPAGSSYTTLTNPYLTTTNNFTSIPPTDTAYLAGQWSVICIDTVTGCQSDLSAPVTVVINPVPQAFPTNNGPVCPGDDIELYGNTIPGTLPGSMWEWYDDSSPKQLVSTNQNPIFSGKPAGIYTYYLVVTVNGCTSDTVPTTVEVLDLLPAPVLPANFAVCEGEAIVLSTTSNAGAYFWTGPNGYSSSLQQPPAIFPAMAIHEGWYKLTISIGGCASAADSVYVTVHPRPAQPVLSTNAPVCFGEDLTLSTTALSGGYRWLAPDGSDTVTSTPSITVGTSSAFYQDGLWQVISINYLTGCESVPSFPVNAIIKDVPVAIAQNNGPVCSGFDIQLFGNTIPGTLPGAMYTWYSDASLSNVISTLQNPVISGLADGSHTFYLVVTVNGCESLPVATTAIVNPVLAPPQMPASFAVCEGDAIVLGTPTWADTYAWIGPNGFTSSLQNPAAILNSTVLHQGWYYLSVSINGCGSATDSVFVTVNAKPATPLIVSNGPICDGEDLILSTTASCGEYRWIAPDGSTYTGIGSSLSIPAGDPMYQDGLWSVICINPATACESDPATAINVVINPVPLAIAQNSSPVCSGDDVQLFANTIPGTLSGAMYTWYSDATLLNVISTLQNPFITGLADGTHNFYLVVTVDGCESLPVLTTVVVAPVLPAPQMQPDFAVCEEDAIVLSTPTVANTYSWTGPNGFVSNLQHPAAILNASSLNEGWYVLEVGNNGCGSAADSVYVTVNAKPAAPILVTSAPICEGEDLILSTTSSCGEYRWIAPDGSTMTTTASALLIPDNSPFYQDGLWSVVCIDTLTGCESDASLPVDVVIKPVPLAFAQNNGPVCTGDDVQLLGNTIPGTLPGAMYTWYSDPMLTNIVSTLANPVISGLPVGAHSFYLVVTVDGCESLPVITTAIVSPVLPAPQMQPDFAVCEGDAIVLSTPTAASFYDWTGPNGFTSNLQHPPAILNATALNEGWYVLSIGVNGCGSAEDSVYVTVNPKPAMPVLVNNGPICDGEDLILSTTAISGEYRWIAPDGSTATTLTANLSIASGNSLYQDGLWQVVCIDPATGCESDASLPVNAVIYPVPVAIAQNNGPVCSGDDVQLFGNTVPGTLPGALYTWYSDSTLSNVVSTLPNPTITGLADGTHHFYLVVTVNGCESLPAMTTVIVSPILPAPLMQPDFAVCEDDAIVLTTPTVASTYNWTGPNGFTSNLQHPTAIQNASILNQGWYVLSVGVNGCGSAEDSVYVTVNPKPAIPVLVNNGPICDGEDLILSTTASSGAYRWIAPDGSSATTNSATLVIASGNSLYQDGLWQLVCIDTATACESDPSAAVNAVIYPVPVAIAQNNGPVCSGDDVQLLGNTIPGTLPGVLYTWYSDSLLTNVVSTLPNPVITGLPDGTHHFYLVVTVNGCESLPAMTTVIVSPILPPPQMQPDFAVCEDDAIVLFSLTAADTYLWTGPNGFTSTLQYPPAIQNATALNEGYYVLRVGINGCGSAEDSVYVTVNPKPAVPVIVSNAPICEGEDLILSTTAVSDAYIWTAPDGSTITTLAPVLTLDVAHSLYQDGLWTVQSLDTATACVSDPASAINVVIYPVPVAVPSNNGPVCAYDPAQLFGNTLPGTLPGALYAWYSDSSMTNLVSTQQDPVITGLNPGMHTYYLVVTVNGCASIPVATDLSVLMVPAAPAMQTDFAVCEDDAIVVSTSTLADQYFWTGPNGFTSSLQHPAAILNASILDEGWYVLQVAVNGCISDADSVYVTVNPKPLLPVLSGNSPICEGEDLIFTTTAVSDNYRWIAPDGSQVTTAVSQLVIAYGAPLYQDGNWTLVSIDTNTGCESNISVPYTAIINPVPIAIAGNNGPVCSGSPVQLFASSITNCANCATYTWYAGDPNAGGVLVSALQNPLIAGLPDGLHDFYLIVVADGCESIPVVTTVEVSTILPAPIMPADFAVCADDYIQLGTPTIADQYFWNGPAGFNSNLQNPALITNVGAANEGYYTLYTMTNGCISLTDSVYVTVNTKPFTPVIISNTPICEGEDLILSTTSSCGNYRWIAPDGSVFVTTSNYLTLSANDVLYQDGLWSVVCIDTLTACESYAAPAVTAIINPVPVAIAQNSGPVCSGFDVQLFANTIPGLLPGALYTWYDDAALTNVISTQQDPVITGLADGAHTFYLVVTVNNCASLPVSTTAIVSPILPAPQMQADFAVCEDELITLSTATVADSYQWYGPNGFTSALQHPAVIGPATQAHEGWYVLSVTINGCGSATDSVYVTVNPKPATPVLVSNGPICEGENLILSTTAISGNYRWIAPDGSTALTAQASLSIALGDALYQDGIWTLVCIDTNTMCESDPSAGVNVVINPVPVAIANNSGPVCSGFDIQLFANTIPGTLPGVLYTWYSDAALTNVVSTNPNPVISGLADGSHNFYLVVTVDGCESLPVMTTAVVNSILPPPQMQADFAVCEDEAIVLTTYTAASTYHWTGPNGFVSNLQNPPAINTASALNEGYYVLNVTINGCGSASDSVYVTVNPKPALPVLTTNSPICDGELLVLSTTAVAGNYLWIAPDGSSITTATDILAIAAGDPFYQDGNWNLITIDTNTSCQSDISAASMVEIRPIPLALASNGGTVCYAGNVQLYGDATPSCNNCTSFAWYDDNPLTGGSLISIQQNPVLMGVPSGTYTYWLVATVDGCPSPPASTTVTVLPLLPAPALPADFAVCEGDVIQLGTSTPADEYLWTGPNGFSSSLQNPPVISAATQSDEGYYVLRYRINGCLSAADSVYVTVQPIPAQPVLTTNSPICSGEDLILSTTAGCGNYVWTAPDGSFTTTTSAVLTLSASDPMYQDGSWTVTCIDTVAGCVSPVSVPVNVTIFAVPLGIASNNGDVCQGIPVQLTGNSVPGTLPGTMYTWYSDSALSILASSQQNPVLYGLNPGTYTYWLVITVNGCTSIPVSTTFTVKPIPPAPQPSSNSPVCEGDDIMLMANTVADNYLWTGPAGFMSSAQNPVIANAGAINGGFYQLIVTQNGCSSAPTNIKVDILPKPATPVIAANGPLCEGDMLILSTTTYSGQSVSYIWTGPNGFSDTTQVASTSIPNTTTANAGAYDVVAVVNGCPSLPSAPVQVTVLSTPLAPMPVAVFSDSNNCTGGTLTLSATGDSSHTYSWTGPNGFAANGQTVSITNAGTQYNGTYVVVVNNGNCTTSGSVTYNDINALPSTPSISAPSVLCEGDLLQVITAPYSGYNAIYHWYTPNGIVSDTIPSLTIFPASVSDEGFYSLVVEVDGCLSLSSGQVYVEVDAMPIPPNPTFTYSDSNFCAGGILTLIASGDSNHIYLWTGPNGFSAAGQVVQILNAGVSANGTYSVTVINGNCSRTGSVTINSIVPNPATPVITGSPPLCEGDLLLLSTTAYSGAMVNYHWNTPTGLVITATSSLIIPSVSVADAGAYSVMVQVDGCFSQPSASTIVTVIPTPPAPAINANDSVFCQGDVLTLSTPTIASHYFWTGPNGFASTQQQPPAIGPLTPLHSGTYSLFITSSGCPSPSSNISIVVNPAPPTPIITSNGPVCIGDPIVLSTTANCGEYIWTAPNGLLATTTSSPLTISQGSALYQAGQWSVICVDPLTSCQSLPSIPVNVSLVPVPVSLPTNTGPVCQGDPVTLQGNYVPNAVYYWFDNNAGSPGTLISTNQNHTINNLAAGTHIFYLAVVTGCSSDTIPTTVTVNPPPPAPLPTYNGPVCTGNTIQLFANTTADSYFWTGPNGFTSTLANPSISNASTWHAGFYYLTVTVNGCTSPTPGSVQVDVINTNITPIISGNSPLCEGDMLMLTSTTIGGSLGAQYIWFGPNGLTDTTNLPTYIIPQVSTLNSGLYYVMASVNGCTTQPSTPVYITVKPRPAQPTIFANTPVCEDDDLVLYTTTNADEYHWSGPNGFSSGLKYPPALTGVTPLNTGTYTLYTTVNGCNSYDTSIYVVVEPKPLTPLIFSNSPVCDQDTLRLWATGQGDAWLWTLPSGFTVTTTNSMLEIVPAAASDAGTYKVQMIIGSCTSDVSLPETVDILVIPPDIAYAGEDQIVCAGNSPVVVSGNVTNLEGMWTTNSNAVIVSPTSPTTIVTNLIPGQSYELYWTLSNPACGGYSTDTLVLTVAMYPIAGTDTIELQENEPVTFANILHNDSTYGWDITTAITFEPTRGSADLNIDHTLNYYPRLDYFGRDSLIYRVCLDVCPDMCDDAKVYFEISPYIWIPDIITPDGDGVNDAFTIVGIHNYPDNEVYIYNRWGQEVFHTIDYQNDWYGTFKNQELPDGTYYYVFLDRSNGKLIQKGYITIHR